MLADVVIPKEFFVTRKSRSIVTPGQTNVILIGEVVALRKQIIFDVVLNLINLVIIVVGRRSRRCIIVIILYLFVCWDLMPLEGDENDLLNLVDWVSFDSANIFA